MLSGGVPSDSRKGKEMRDPFKDSGSADDWFNNIWTADVDMNAAMYGNTGTDMLYKSLIPKSPELTDIIDRADKRFGLGEALRSLFALLYMKEPEKNGDGGILEQPVTDGVIRNEKYSQLKALCKDKRLPHSAPYAHLPKVLKV